MQPADRHPCSESPAPRGPGKHDELWVPSRDTGTQSGTLEEVVTLGDFYASAASNGHS